MSAIQQALLMAATAGDGDPYFSDVALLLHGNGTNGSTTIADNSVNGYLPTVGGSVQISTAQSLFGGASISLDGSTSFVRYADALPLRLGGNDFTVEVSIRPASVSGYRCIAEHRDAFTAHGWTLYQDGTTLYFQAGDDNTAGWEVSLSAASALSADTFHRIAVTRSGTTWRLFINGSIVASATVSVTIMMSSAGTPYLTFGKFYNDSGYFSGHMEEIRITNGACRYAATYTPDGPFLDS